MSEPLIELKPNRSGYLTADSLFFWRSYKKDKKKKFDSVDYSVWSSFIDDVFFALWEEMIVNKYRFKAPAGLGEFYVSEVQSDKEYTQYVDWQESKKRGKKVYKYNFHSNGIKFFIKWSKILAGFKHHTIYAFEPYRGARDELAGSRGLNKHIRKCNEDPKMGFYRAHID